MKTTFRQIILPSSACIEYQIYRFADKFELYILRKYKIRRNRFQKQNKLCKNDDIPMISGITFSLYFLITLLLTTVMGWP